MKEKDDRFSSKFFRRFRRFGYSWYRYRCPFIWTLSQCNHGCIRMENWYAGICCSYVNRCSLWCHHETIATAESSHSKRNRNGVSVNIYHHDIFDNLSRSCFSSRSPAQKTKVIDETPPPSYMNVTETTEVSGNEYRIRSKMIYFSFHCLAVINT